MAHSRVTVFGGSGFLGRQIVKRLADDGADVRVAVRRPERAAFLTEARRAGQIAPVYADVWDEASVAPVVDGSDAVINTVGHYVERGKATFEAIHGQGAMHVARASAMAGVRRLVHISGLGADPKSDSAYVRARGIGEDLVKEAFPAFAACHAPWLPGRSRRSRDRWSGHQRECKRAVPTKGGSSVEASLQAFEVVGEIAKGESRRFQRRIDWRSDDLCNEGVRPQVEQCRSAGCEEIGILVEQTTQRLQVLVS
jgi:NAD(P)-dependent dehydrogenase (short-subunit alcohol dehydrogenase family)